MTLKMIKLFSAVVDCFRPVQTAKTGKYLGILINAAQTFFHVNEYLNCLLNPDILNCKSRNLLYVSLSYIRSCAIGHDF